MASKRTTYVVMTNEARVLKRLREKAGLSMRQAGDLMGYSGSLVSQIENGRENPPKGERLRKFLDAYGVEQRAYTRMVTEFKEEVSDLEIVLEIVPRLKPDNIKMIRLLAEQLIC